MKLRVAAATINTTPMDWKGNTEKILQCIQEAKIANVKMLCLPELCITGYGCEDMFLSPATTARALDELNKIAIYSSNMILSVGLPIQHKGAVYNCVATIVNGKVKGFTAKQHLAGDGVHYETRQFKPWPEGVRTTEEVTGLPLGDIYFQGDGQDDKGVNVPSHNIRFGYEICEDAWVARRPGGRLAEQGIDIILNPSASHFAFDKIDTRERFVIEGSRAFTCGYIYSNLSGNEAGRTIYDGGAMIASNGEMLARGKRLHFQNISLTIADMDLYDIRQRQSATASRLPNPATDENLVKVALDFDWLVEREFTPAIEPYNGELQPWEASNKVDRRYEEFTRAIALGLYDYMRKSKTAGYTVSLSGGADSATVTAIIFYLRKLAKEEGIEVGENILTTIYQSTANSGNITREAAKMVAEACGAEHHEIDIDLIVREYTKIIETTIGRKLTWEKDDITLQNIQARSRGPSVWMLANVKNQLLLTTSNRSEAAVGYATMDGDTCGSISPISGVSKAFIRAWLRWAEVKGPTLEGGHCPMAALSYINNQQPTAELRPEESGQTDEKDLMPYPILDEIENQAIGHKKYPAEVLEVMLEKHPESEKGMKGWIKKFFSLWCRNQWKRERYAPGLHVDDKNLDPRSWCRFPILNAGYQEELSKLEKND